MTKKKRRKKGKKYFTQVHEDAILEYKGCDDPSHRNVVYRDVIRPVFLEMINKIVFTYKFTNLPNIHMLKDECEIHLITILSNFDETKGSKAFSYLNIYRYIILMKKIERKKNIWNTFGWKSKSGISSRSKIMNARS